jgi:hypothetical protein
MAGENVTEHIVRRIFVEALDLVVHLDRDDVARADGHVRRQVSEIVAVVPSLTEGETYEPLFVREGLGSPLEWTGALPPSFEQRVDRVLPEGAGLRRLLERGRMSR